ncbi:MAG TPA: NlpC/P60 family protein [Syntrophobacteria bacterium]|nr:NlpC/P60 family protein [Syntrophobacteria bacterium]
MTPTGDHRPHRRVRRWPQRGALLGAPLVLVVLAFGCAGRAPSPAEPTPGVAERHLPLMGHSIQVGAFSRVENAVRLNSVLEGHGLNAYYFLHRTGLYKVRFGNYPSRESAFNEAERLRAAGIIEEYYIVSPDEYAVAQERKLGGGYVRREIVATAKSFMGLPYQWGGSSAEEGFDCSGLTMAVYQLNGLNLPRSTAEQYLAGAPVKRGQLAAGDLVFFATSGGRKASHVGIYTGDGRFIHAPGQGKNIQADFLTTTYYADRYLGARTFVR